MFLRSLRLLPIALCFLAPSAAAQTYARWDTSLFDQPGQRSLFLRTPNGGANGLPLGGGDVNGDGRDDILVCAFTASEAWLFISPPAIGGIREAVATAGEVTRIFGAETLGVECADGDVNGDGLADLVIGAPGVPGSAPGAGAVYVVFGSPAHPPSIDVAAPGSALAILGTDANDHLGVWVDVVDVDGDGFGDILMGAPDADGPDDARDNAGEAHVLFGGPDLVPGSRALADYAAAGRLFTVFGADPSDKTGSTLDAGRIDGGALADLVVGSGLNRAAVRVFDSGVGAGDGPDNLRGAAGEVAIVFNPARGGSVDLRAPPPDVTIVFGADPNDYLGEEVDVGDADGDGRGDVLIGALTGDGFANLRGEFAGEAYLIYGGDGLRGRRIDLAAPPEGVTAVYGPTAGGITGDSARFIDVDGDGRGDLFIASPTGTFIGPDGRERTGALFFVRSPSGRLPPVIDLDDPPVESLPFGVILAADPGDILAYSLVVADADGDGGDDVVVNGMTGSGLNNQFPAAGEAYVIDGATLASALQPFASGDVTGDGVADIRDVQLVIAALVGSGGLSDAQRGAADTNGNGGLDEGDLVGVVERVLGRNLLASGGLLRALNVKQTQEPGYRYEEPYAGSDGHGAGYGESGDDDEGDADDEDDEYAEGAVRAFAAQGTSAAPGLALSLTADVPLIGAGQAEAYSPHDLAAIRATFTWPYRVAPRILAAPGVHVHAGIEGGKLRVLAFAEASLPVNRPLFRFAEAGPWLEALTGGTRGGSVRTLERTARSLGKPAAPARPARPLRGDTWNKPGPQGSDLER